jgi:hypothetical protein
MRNAAPQTRRSMHRILATCSTLCLAASSSGCTSFGALDRLIGPAQPEPAVVVQCPARKAYEKPTIVKSADELRGLLKTDPQAATPVLVHDYRTLRQACDAIEKK